MDFSVLTVAASLPQVASTVEAGRLTFLLRGLRDRSGLIPSIGARRRVFCRVR